MVFCGLIPDVQINDHIQTTHGKIGSGGSKNGKQKCLKARISWSHLMTLRSHVLLQQCRTCFLICGLEQLIALMVRRMVASFRICNWFLNPEDLLIFRGDLVHAGAGFDSLNVRIHTCYGSA